MRIYFVRAGQSGPVKIGTASWVKNRVAMLQRGHYETLHLLREIEGGRMVEAWLHREFRHLHRRGEWFDFAPEMLTVVPPPLVEKPDRRRHGHATVAEFLEALAEHESTPKPKRRSAA